MQIGVDAKTVWNWETGKAVPALRAIPKVLQLLGYDPRPEAWAFPEQIQLLRQGLGLSIRELARKIGVDPSTVQKWERLGYRPHPRLHARLARVLDIPEPSEDAPLGERLQARRLALGLTQKEAAARIGVSQDTVSRWERGRARPGLDELRRTCTALSMGLETRAASGLTACSAAEASPRRSARPRVREAKDAASKI